MKRFLAGWVVGVLSLYVAAYAFVLRYFLLGKRRKS